jgi:hypothetical protein
MRVDSPNEVVMIFETALNDHPIPNVILWLDDLHHRPPGELIQFGFRRGLMDALPSIDRTSIGIGNRLAGAKYSVKEGASLLAQRIVDCRYYGED